MFELQNKVAQENPGDCVTYITFGREHSLCDLDHILGLIQPAKRFPGNTQVGGYQVFRYYIIQFGV